jgi:hypothetical protein
MKFAQYTESKRPALKQIPAIRLHLKKAVIEDEDEYEGKRRSSSSSLFNAQWLAPYLVALFAS